MAMALDKAVLMATIMGSVLFGIIYSFSLLRNSLKPGPRRFVYFHLRIDNLHPALPEEKIATIEQNFTRCFDSHVRGGFHGKR